MNSDPNIDEAATETGAASVDEAQQSTEQTGAGPHEGASASDGEQAPTGALSLGQQLLALGKERDDFKERWMRAEAEMQNVRTRTKREVEDARQYALQKFARDVAEAADNLRRGLDSLPKAEPDESALLQKLREGFEGVERSFLGLLERNGIARIDPTLQPFDPNMHQAMAEQPSADHPNGTVLQAWTAAWTLNGRLLRPAMVVVSKAETTAG